MERTTLNQNLYNQWIEQRKWLETYDLRKYDQTITAEEAFTPILSKEIRDKRNDLLVQSDWSQFQDSPLSEESKLAWQTYRQKLRDITTQDGFPYSVVWPNKP